MKKWILGILCLAVWLCVELSVVGGDGPPVVPPTVAPTNTVAAPPPIQPDPVALTPTPTKEPPPDLPFGEGERMGKPGTGFPKQPAKPTAKPKKYVVIGMYEHMLAIVQHKRLWPINDVHSDGCVMLHNNDWICP